MKLLLDTHVVLWWLDDPALLTENARNTILDMENDVFVERRCRMGNCHQTRIGKIEHSTRFAVGN